MPKSVSTQAIILQILAAVIGHNIASHVCSADGHLQDVKKAEETNFCDACQTASLRSVLMHVLFACRMFNCPACGACNYLRAWCLPDCEASPRTASLRSVLMHVLFACRMPKASAALLSLLLLPVFMHVFNFPLCAISIYVRASTCQGVPGVSQTERQAPERTAKLVAGRGVYWGHGTVRVNWRWCRYLFRCLRWLRLCSVSCICYRRRGLQGCK